MNKYFDKKFKYGAYSTVISLVVIGVLIVINLLIGEFDYKFDTTGDSTYSVSDETQELLSQLTDEINIYTTFKTGSNDAIVSRVEKILDQYDKSPEIVIENKDIYLYPEFAKNYTAQEDSVQTNSIIVQKGSKYKIINYSDYYTSQGLNVESCVTSAIQYVGLENDPVLYFVTGHGELEPEQFTNFKAQAELANYKLDTVNLLTNDVPKDATALVITTSYQDYSVEEAEKIKTYLTNDGRAIFIVSEVSKQTHPNLMSVMEAYGVTLKDGYVLEGNSEKYMMYPFYVLPEIKEHDINNSFIDNKYSALVYGGQGITQTEVQKQGLVIEDILTTSQDAYIKAEGNSSPNKEAGDEQGPFTLATAITDSTYTDTSHTTKIVVVSSFYMLVPDADSMVSGGNTTFLLNCVNWLNDEVTNVYISPKSLENATIMIDEGSINTIKVVSWCIIPGILFLAGFVVWLRRHNG